MTNHPITSSDDYGLDDDAMASIEAAGAALTPEPKRKGPRATSLTAARAALDAGQPIPYLELGSLQNPAATDKGWALWRLYAGTDAAGLQAFVIGGSNTYAKLLKGYRDILLASTAAGIEPDGEMISAYQGQWDQKQAEKAAAKAAARAERKAAKAPPATPAEPGPYADVPSADLEMTAKATEELISAERKTADRETQNTRRANAKAMRAELASRLTPADKEAAAKVAASLKAAVKPKPVPTAADTALVKRGGGAPKPPVKTIEPRELAEGEKLEAAPLPKGSTATEVKAKAAAKAPAKAKAAPKAEASPKVEVFKSVMGARKSAREALGEEAVEGVDFKITGKGKRLSWIPIGMNAPKG